MIRKITLFHKPIITHLTYLLITFLLVFPKGGFKLGAIPFTWGYLLLISFSGFLALKTQYILTKERLIVLMCLLPFQILCILSLFINGTPATELSFAFLVHIVALPYIFLLFFAESLERINQTYLFTLIKRGVFFVSIYGIIIFFYKLFIGNSFEIPLLTSTFNAHVEEINKFNNRGSVFKLTSTYNNGNIYGICILMLLPLYKTLERSILKIRLVHLSLILTLSRTVWIGLIFVEIFYLIYVKRNRNALFKLILSFILFIATIFLLINVFQFNSNFIWDTTFGGRFLLFPNLSELTFFPSKPFYATEQVYLMMANSYGVFGLLLYLLAMTIGIFSFKTHGHLYPHSATNKAILLGLVSYLFVSIADGAIFLIPTFAFYWCLTSLLLRRSSL